jgi:DNA-binding XRE family transcriptional regulator
LDAEKIAAMYALRKYLILSARHVVVLGVAVRDGALINSLLSHRKHTLLRNLNLFRYLRRMQVEEFPQNKSSTAAENRAKFFKELGRRVRELRQKAGYRQADMVSLGFSMRQWQQIEAGRSISVTTAIRISEVFNIKLNDLVRGLPDY